MNSEQLNAIRQRAEKATPGPWQYFECADAIVCDDYTIAEELSLGYDGIFIAHARQDVPALLSLIAQQQAEVERLRRELSFIANVDLTKNAYDIEHVAVSVKCWALNVLDGVNHDD